MMSNDIGIDLGTASILVYIKGKGVVLKEPSVVAIDRDTNKIKAIGEEARLMIGRTPGNIVAVRPLRQGVISDYTVTEKMLKYFINKAVGKKTLRKPRISVCIPSGATEVEKKAVEDATYQAGAREVSIIEEPVAAAIGAGAADYFAGFGAYIIPTMLAKGVMAYLTGYFLRGNPGRQKEIAVMVIAGVIMTLIYYVSEIILYGSFVSPLVNIPFNALQAIVGIVISMLLFRPLAQDFCQTVPDAFPHRNQTIRFLPFQSCR